jgi:hypothetical protein
MARTQEFGYGEAADRAVTAPVIEQAGAEHVLPDALDHEPFGFGGPRERGGLLFEGAQQLIRERLR